MWINTGIIVTEKRDLHVYESTEIKNKLAFRLHQKGLFNEMLRDSLN